MQSSMTMYFKHRPTGMLGRYVEPFWYRPATAHDADTGMLILPSGRADIVISLDGAAQAGWTALDRGGLRRDLHYATVRLPNCAPVAAALSGGGAAFGVSFKPHGLRHFSRVPLTDLESDVATLEAVWGPRAEELIGRLAEAPTAVSKFAVMETLLWNHMREPHRAHRQVERAVGLLSDPFTIRSVDSVAGEVGLSSRRLLDLLRQDVGLSPKVFARVMRFGAALRLVREKGPARWTDVAATCDDGVQARPLLVLAGARAVTFRALGREDVGAALDRTDLGLGWLPQAGSKHGDECAKT